jgi:hypothetical protein
MTLLASLSRRFLENPHVGRQLARFSPLALGSVLFLVAGGLLLADFFIFQNVLLEDSLLPEGAAGSALHLANALLLYAFLALLLPMRLGGAIDGARTDRSFDQIVVTGWSPLSLHLGNWGLGLGYAGVILAASLPFQAFAYTLGGVTLGEIVEAYLVLLVYANVIIAVTLALAMGERERAVIPVSIFLFLLAGFLSLRLTPASGLFGEATPVRFLLRHSFAGSLLFSRFTAAPSGSVMIFSWPVPEDACMLLLWGLLLLPACVVLLLGPSHRFTPGLNNFGCVPISDRWKKLFRRQFLALTRKVELAFFYENRPRWLDGWDFILRKLPVFAWLFLLWGVIQGRAFGGVPAIDPGTRFFRDPPFLISIGGTAALAFLALIALGDTRYGAGVRERVGPWRVPRGLLLSLCAAAVLACFVALHACTLRAALDAAADAAAARTGPAAAAAAPDPEDLDRFVADWGRFLAAVTILLLNCHLIGKLLALVTGTMPAFGLSLAVIASVLLFAPFFVWLGIDEGWLPPALFPLLFLTPSVLPAIEDAELAAAAVEQGFTPADAFRWLAGLHAAIACAVLALLAAVRWRTRRRDRGSRPAPAARGAAALVLGVGLLLPGPARGADGLPIEVQVTHGFDGRLLGEDVSFFTVVLRNASARTIRGTLHVRAGDPPEDVCPPRPFEAPASTATVLRWSQDNTVSGYAGERLVLEAPEGVVGVDLPEAIAAAGPGQGGAAQETIFLVASEGGRLPGIVRSDHEWVATKPFSLPEDPRAYKGAAAVLIGPTDLSAWTKGQRDALHDYIRLGGSVVLHGPIDRAGLQAVPEWAALIGGKRGSRIVRAGIDLAVEEIDEGEVVWRLEGEGGEPAAPLLTVRAVGPGRLGHLAFDLASGPGVLAPLAGGAEKFWREFEARVPRSAYPAVTSISSPALGAALLDPAPLLAVVLYFVLYVVLLGPGIALGFRKKSRRRWVLPYIAAVSLLFVAAIPLLDLFLHREPSHAAITRVAYFGPGARRGVAQGCLSVRSSGRQRHRVRIDAERPSAYFSTTLVADDFRGIEYSSEPGRLAGPLDLDLPPWGSRQVIIAADVSRAEPITGQVVIEPGAGRGSLRATGLPPPGTDLPLRGRLLLFETAGIGAQGIDLAGASFSQGEAAMDFQVARVAPAASTPPGGRHSLAFPQGIAGSFTIASGAGPRAVLAIVVAEAPFPVESADLVFERELAPEPDGAKARARPGFRLIDRGDKRYRSFEGALILQELPVEIR